MKAKRIIISLLMALVCFTTVFLASCNALGDLGSPSNGVVYQLSQDETFAVVTDYEGKNTEVVVADSYKGKPVKEIDRGSFLGNSIITKIVIPDGITRIGDCAFYGCSNLTDIILAKSVIHIGDSAFTQCNNLKIYYYGAENDFANILIEGNNTEFQNSTVYYYSETHRPNGWHYRWNGDIEIWKYIVGGVPFTYDKLQGVTVQQLYDAYLLTDYKKMTFSEFQTTYFTEKYSIQNMYIGYLKSWNFDVVWSNTNRTNITLPYYLIDTSMRYDGTGFVSIIGIKNNNQVYARLSNGVDFVIANIENILSVAVNNDGLLLFYLTNGQGIIAGRIPHKQELN